MATNSGKFYIGTDTKVTITGLQDETGAYLNASDTVVGLLEDKDSNAVAGGGNIAFTYVTSSQGNFYAYISRSLPLIENALYYLVLTVTHQGRQMQIVMSRTAAYLKA